MNVQEESRDKNVARIAVTLEVEDYKANYEKQLKTYRKQMNMPGFRAGKVPMGLVKQRVGQQLLTQEAFEIGYKALNEHIEEKELKVFGQPILAETDLGQLEPYDQQEYTLDFEVGLIPEFDIDPDSLPEVTEYEVQVSEEEIEELLELQQYREGDKTPADKVVSTDDHIQELTGQFIIVDDKDEDGNDKQITLDFVTMHYKGFTEKLVGKQVDDTIDTTFGEFFEKDFTGANVLQVPLSFYRKELKDKPLKFTLSKISDIEQAELNGELFEKLGGEQAKDLSLEEFKEKYREAMQQSYEERAQNMFHFEMQKAVIDNANFEVDEDFITRMFLSRMEDVENIQELHEKYPNYVWDYKVAVTLERMQELHPELEVTDEDIKDSAADEIRQMFGGAQIADPAAESADVTDDSGVEEVEAEALKRLKPKRTTNKTARSNQSSEDAGDETEEAQAPQQNPLADPSFINMYAERMLSDEQYVNRQRNKLKNDKLFDFLKSKMNVNTSPPTKRISTKLTPKASTSRYKLFDTHAAIAPERHCTQKETAPFSTGGSLVAMAANTRPFVIKTSISAKR